MNENRKIIIHHGNYADVLNSVKADLIFTSPPYNIGSESPAKTGLRNRRLGTYDPKSYGAIRDYPDSLPETEYQDQQAKFLVWAADHLTVNGTVVYNHKPRRRNGAMIHPAEWFLRPEVRSRLTLMEEIIWDRKSTHNHGDRVIWPHTERLYVFRRTDGKYRFQNTKALPYRSDVWAITRHRGNGHACPFPIELAKGVILAWSKPGELVCDPYAGSGTAGIAARELDRQFVGAEIQKKYWRMGLEKGLEQDAA